MSAEETYTQTGANLVSIASKYILLVESRRNLKGRCPFHADQGTSFMLSPEKKHLQMFWLRQRRRSHRVYHVYGGQKPGRSYRAVDRIRKLKKGTTWCNAIPFLG